VVTSVATASHVVSVRRCSYGERVWVHQPRARLPVITYAAEEVPHAYLMSYGQDFPDFFRRPVSYTDKILKGAKPADLPVEQPTRLKPVLNQKRAKALGLTFPYTLTNPRRRGN